jgi:hypothetical protein
LLLADFLTQGEFLLLHFGNALAGAVVAGFENEIEDSRNFARLFFSKSEFEGAFLEKMHSGGVENVFTESGLIDDRRVVKKRKGIRHGWKAAARASLLKCEAEEPLS